MSVRITWLGQSGLLLEGGGQTVLIDPWLSPHPERATPAPTVRWPPTIDLVLITHGHGDHLDLPGLAAIGTAVSEIVVPTPHLDVVAAQLPHFERLGVRPNSQVDRLGGLTVLPARHGIAVSDGYSTLIDANGDSPQVGYAFTLDGTRFYVAGDTLADPALVNAVGKLAPDLVALPVNGRDTEREARGILGNMNTREAADFAVAVGAQALLPLHHDGVIGNTADISELSCIAQGMPFRLLLPALSIPFEYDGTRSS